MSLPALFNPSNDMALATNLRQYYPPRRIQQMERDLESLARFWDNGPWGWSLATKQRYLRMGVAESDLPSDEWLEEVRRLSSREFATTYYKNLSLSHHKEKENSLVPCHAQFCTCIDEVKQHFSSSAAQAFILKAPWSSSGRGNMVVRDTIDPTIQKRIEAIIREQGGIVAEPFYADKVLDFAMEFRATDEGVEFLGYSVFEADDTGHYGGNYVEDQPSLVKRIDLDESLLQDLVAYHQQELRKLNYRGPIGIDMMKLKDGRVHPCVEINFRMTMGMLALLLYNKGIREDQLLTPCREQGFMAEIRQGRLSIAFNKS